MPLELLPYTSPAKLFDSLSDELAHDQIHPDVFMPTLRNKINSTLDQLLGYRDSINESSIDIQKKEWLLCFIQREYTVWLSLDDRADRYFDYMDYSIKYFDVQQKQI